MSQQADDHLAIEKLMSRYAHFGDRGFALAGADSTCLAALFTEDGVWESGTLARFAGREAIAAGIGTAPVSGVVHLLLNPDIEIAGDSATGRWKSLLMLSGVDGRGRCIVGHYEVRFVRQAGGWLIERLSAGSVGQFPAPGLTWVA